MAVPIYVGGEVIGSVNLGNGKDGWHEEQVPPLRMFATLLGGVMLMFEHRDRCVGRCGAFHHYCFPPLLHTRTPVIEC